MALRRARGLLLRFTRHRVLVMTVGLLLAVPATWIELSGRAVAWWVSGLCLVFGATGLAFFWTGLTGAQPDWVDTDQGPRGA